MLYKLIDVTSRVDDKGKIIEYPIYSLTYPGGLSIKAVGNRYDFYEYERDDEYSHIFSQEAMQGDAYADHIAEVCDMLNAHIASFGSLPGSLTQIVGEEELVEIDNQGNNFYNLDWDGVLRDMVLNGHKQSINDVQDVPVSNTVDELPFDDNNSTDKEAQEVGEENVSETRRLENSNFDYENAEFYSGGAVGSDTEWANIAKQYGIKIKEYLVSAFDKLPQEWKARLDAEYKHVVNILGRKELPIDSYSGKLVRRDMMQADKADAVFAIARIGESGEVLGGTAYAVTRAEQRGIPVYLYDQNDEKWLYSVYEDGKIQGYLEFNGIPTLTTNAAVIGTREINESGKQAIKDVFQKTLVRQEEQKSTTAQSEEFYSAEDADDHVRWLIYAEEVPKEDIQVIHTPETETEDEYWTVVVKKNNPLNLSKDQL
jgi:hypothetical protein